jgi:hypothetical protein
MSFIKPRKFLGFLSLFPSPVVALSSVANRFQDLGADLRLACAMVTAYVDASNDL